MKYLLISALACSLTLVSCRHNDGPTNEYKNAKTHESDKIAKERKKLNRKAEKQAKKNMKTARKSQRKKQRSWFKKGTYN
jgi:Tfp pilus assembly protein PilF